MLAFGTALLSACSAEAIREVPVVDAIRYVSELRERRPDLYRTDCPDTLRLKPRYRAALLDGTDTYASLVARTYRPAEREADVAWIAAHQEAMVQFCREAPEAGACARICERPCEACPADGTSPAPGPSASLAVRPAGYSLCGAVGYVVGEGPGGLPWDPDGVVESWKVFFELGEARITPEAYFAYFQRLSDRGFRGDAKLVTTRAEPERARYHYNGVIVHAWSPADARVAEEVGLAHFGAAVDGHGRGLDVRSPGASGRDWHTFLCEGDLGVLSDEALAFVGHGTRPVFEPAALTPLSAYRADPVGVLSVLWHPRMDREPAFLATVRAALGEDLEAVARLATPAALERLAGVRIAVAPTSPEVRDLPARGRGIATHRSANWLVAHGIDAAREGVIEIYRAQDYLDARGRGPMEILHALTHVLQLRADAATLEALDAAYEAAVAGGAYDAVAFEGAKPGQRRRAWAMRDAGAYAGELAQAFFARNDHFPFVREELVAFDPAGCAAVAGLWSTECVP